MKDSKPTPVMWRFATVAPRAEHDPFHYDEARSLNVVRNVDGQAVAFATSPSSTAFVKSDRAGEAED
ncbi:MAG TPA: hypothetical protein VHT05_09855 [Candidatus Elarobacter sp.]|jgi:hypothetical protein|nr:hypothetical protein [Candidatus Elarobacter sp.]